jgi:hypothetical protein
MATDLLKSFKVHFGRVTHTRLAILTLITACSLSSCGPTDDEKHERLGSVTQAVDVDSDGMDDAWETTYFGSLTRDGT